MPSPGIGGSGYMGIAHETTMGTYVAPAVFIPFLDESLSYSEDKYYSPAIRKVTLVGDMKQNYYHAEGDVDWEVDCAYLPYFMYCMRLSIVKTGAGPYVYTATPSSGGAAGIGGNAATQKTMSVTIVRNGRVFKYVGCAVTGWNYRIEDGVAKSNMTIMGLGETGASGDSPPAPTFTVPSLMGAAAHTVSVAPSISSGNPVWVENDNFGGFTFAVNDNGAAQTRIKPNRQAAYISFGESEVTIATTLDFLDGTQYDQFVAATASAFQIVSAVSGTEGVEIDAFRGVYNTYPVNNGAIGDIVTADAEIRVLAQPSRSFQLICKSATSIT